MEITDDRYEERIPILTALFNDHISPQSAVESLADVSLSDGSLEGGVERTWEVVILAAKERPEQHQNLVDLLECMSRLPDYMLAPGKPLVTDDNGAKVWVDMPFLGWMLNHEWNGLTIPPSPGPARDAIISGFINLNAFTARLLLTKNPAYPYQSCAIWTMRPALETPHQVALNPAEAFIPAAAQWILIIGHEIFRWDMQFPHGRYEGDPGGSGPLYGEPREHGFSTERWTFWKKRFGKLAVGAEMSEDLKAIAREAEQKMAAIESA